MTKPLTPSAEIEKLLLELDHPQYKWMVDVGSERVKFVPVLLSYIRSLQKERDSYKEDACKAVEALDEANSTICSEFCCRHSEHHWRCDPSREALSSLNNHYPPTV